MEGCEKEKEEMLRQVEEDVDGEVTYVKLKMYESCDKLQSEKDKLKSEGG